MVGEIEGLDDGSDVGDVEGLVDGDELGEFEGWSLRQKIFCKEILNRTNV